jgi:uncharacterized protein YrzB (UPF0473 family)
MKMNRRTVRTENGEDVTIEILVNFKVEEYDKEYVGYTLNDDNNSFKVKVFISEIQYDASGKARVSSIRDDEKDLVLCIYNNIRNSICA